MPHVELSAFIPRLNLENVIGPRIAGCGLHLEDVGRDRASGHHIHIPVQDGKGLVSAARVLSWTHTAVITDKQIWLLTANGVNALEAPLQVVASLLQVAGMIPVFTLIDVLAASVVFQQDVARGAGAKVGARLVNTLMLAEELREAALVHITATDTVIFEFIAWITAADERAVGIDAGLHARILSVTFIHILTRPPVIIEGEPRVAGTGIRPGDICTQLLAVAVATFIDV